MDSVAEHTPGIHDFQWLLKLWTPSQMSAVVGAQTLTWPWAAAWAEHHPGSGWQAGYPHRSVTAFNSSVLPLPTSHESFCFSFSLIAVMRLLIITANAWPMLRGAEQSCGCHQPTSTVKSRLACACLSPTWVEWHQGTCVCLQAVQTMRTRALLCRSFTCIGWTKLQYSLNMQHSKKNLLNICKIIFISSWI